MNKIYLVAVIVIFSFYIYYPLLEREDANVSYENDNCCNFTITVNIPDLGKPSWINFFRKITSPFNFEYYNLYVELTDPKDHNCPVELVSASTQIKNMIYLLPVNDPVFIDSFKTESLSVIQGNNSLTYKFKSGGNEDSKICTLTTSSKLYAYTRISIWDYLGNSLIAFFAYLGIVLLLKEGRIWVVGNRKSEAKKEK